MTDDSRMTTYRYGDAGRAADWEYSFMSDLDYFEDEAADVGYLEVVEEVWVLEKRTVLKLGSLFGTCSECDEDVELDVPVDGTVRCSDHPA